MNKSNRVRNYSDTGSKKREVLIGIIAAMAVLGFVFYGISNMGKQVGQSGMHGIVIEKHFDPLEQTHISVGKSGLSKREVKGQYWFKVHVQPRDLYYSVQVPRGVYQKYKIGDKYFFVRPPKIAPSNPSLAE